MNTALRLSERTAPPKVQVGLKHFERTACVRVLDIGCGNNSPSVFKRWFPNAIYHGVDIQEYNLSDDDRVLMDCFTVVRPEQNYRSVISESFDWIVCNHVLEHMQAPYDRVNELCGMLRRNGLMYCAFPSVESLRMPSAQGTLQFCDDKTHVFLPSITDVANILLRNQIHVIYGGRRRDSLRVLVSLPLFAWQMVRRLLGHKMHARGLWPIYGFEASVVGVKP